MLNNFCKKKKINFYILRIFNVYGKNENFSIISKLNKKKIKVRIANNGKSIRDFIHIDDLTKVYKLFINKKILTGIYDVGTGKGVSVKKLINLSRSNNKNVTYIKKPIQEVSKSIASIEYFKKYNMRIKFKNVINYMAE
ncbi:UDP-glucose 4-epimerase [Candidatus Pelagibacter sp. IMCC9063]|nr:UDP-glucose 4-epimerase [Candidatus Pelagibacter sp. IMCC9063]